MIELFENDNILNKNYLDFWYCKHLKYASYIRKKQIKRGLLFLIMF